MKKSLLIAVAAIMVVLSASAQQKRVAQATKMNAPVATKMNVTKAPAAIAKRAIEKNQPARRAAGIAGTYILNYANLKGDFTASSSFEIVEKPTSTVKVVDMEDDNYAETIDFEYNVQLNGFTSDDAVVYGKYDSTEGTIHIPVQVIGEDETYGRILLMGLTSVDGEAAHYGLDIILTVDENGSLELYDAEEELAAAGGYAEGEIISGWYSLLPDYEDGLSAWNFGNDIEFYQPNATMIYTTTGKRLGGEVQGSWNRNVNKRVYIEDYGTEIVINNFLGLCPISVTVNADGTCYIPFGQKVFDRDFSDDSFEYGYICLTGCVIDGNGIKTDDTVPQLNGFWDETEYDFFKTEYKEAWTDEDGEHEAGNYFVDNDPNYCRYFNVCSKFDTEDQGYGFGFCCNLYIVKDEDTTGITEAKATAAQNNAKVYNLLGQEVNGDVKGLVIKNGKKYVNK